MDGIRVVYTGAAPIVIPAFGVVNPGEEFLWTPTEDDPKGDALLRRADMQRVDGEPSDDAVVGEPEPEPAAATEATPEAAAPITDYGVPMDDLEGFPPTAE